MKKALGLAAVVLLIVVSTEYGRANAHGTPPQEAIDACADKAVGDVCSVVTPKGDSVEGTCDQPPDSETIACRPNNFPKM